MKKIYKIVFVILIALIMLIPATAFAQTIDINYDECTVISAPSGFYWPFEVVTRHDPAIAQRITDKHANAPNAQLAIEKPQTDKAEDATWISFKNSANQTANWEIQLDLEYLSETVEDREIIIEMYSNNQKVANHKLFQDGKNFCIVYNLIVSNPPHDWTDEEILQVSSQLTKDEFSAVQKEIAKNNVVIGDSSRFDNIQTLVLGGLGVLLIVGSWKARDRIKVENKLIRYEREQLEEARATLEMNDDYRNLKINQGLEKMTIEKNRIYQDVISMVQLAFAKKDDGPTITASLPFEQSTTIINAVGPIHTSSDPSDSNYIPGPVEFDAPGVTEKPQPGLTNRLSFIKSKLPFQSKDKSFEEYTEEYLIQELDEFDSKVDKVKQLKKMWDDRIKVAQSDPSGVASREVEVIRKVWMDLLT